MRKLLLSIMAACTVLVTSASETITLTVNGQGATKEIAVANALRSAIEQAFGVFVSANTEILNDNLVKDEIATISSGNIQSYQEISCVNMPNGEVAATLSATVAIGKLVAYAKSHGSSAEFAGQTFAMNIKMLDLNKRNEEQALEHMLSQLRKLAPNVFDWSLKIGNPQVDGDKYKIPMQVTAISNEASDAFYKTLIGTLKSLSLSETELSHYQQIGMPTYAFEIRSYDNLNNAWRKSVRNLLSGAITVNYEPQKTWQFVLRSNYEEFLNKLGNLIRSLNSSFAIREMGASSQLHTFGERDLNNPIAFNEDPWYGGTVESVGLAILNLHQYSIRSVQKKKQTQPTIYQNNVYTHRVEVIVDQNRIASISGFEITTNLTLNPNNAATIFQIGYSYIAKGDALSEEMNQRNYTSYAEMEADAKKAQEAYKEAVSYMEKAYELNPYDISTVKALKALTFHLREEEGMMEKYNKYNALYKEMCY